MPRRSVRSYSAACNVGGSVASGPLQTRSICAKLRQASNPYGRDTMGEPTRIGTASDRWRVQTMKALALAMLTLASSAKAGQLPAEMWADDTKYGHPSITAGPDGSRSPYNRTP